MIEIDGSILEGGGQILRMSIALSVLTQKPIRISKIRAGRSKPGLAAQHLKGIELVREMCNGKLVGGVLGSTEIKFTPNKIKGGSYYSDIQTAGSLALILQVALPVALFSDSKTTLDLKGGTNADMAPQIDFSTEIFRPNLEKFGASFDFDLFKRGYFPKGGGHCQIDITPIRQLNPVDLTNFGNVESFFGWSFVAGVLPVKVAQEMSDGARNYIKSTNPRSSIKIESYKESEEMSRANCSGIILGCSTTSNCILGGSALGSKKFNSFETGKKAAEEVLNSVSVRACVDQYVQDQLIIFMALAKEKSVIKTSPITLHTTTAIFIAELFTEAKFKVTNDETTCTIECEGIGLENKFL